MNIYHCCAHKTASQWVKSIFNDPETLAGTNLKVYDYYKEDMLPKIIEGQNDFSNFDVLPPPDTVLSPVYVTYETFEALPKHDDYRVFAIIRDPRDIIVSWYFSVKLTHAPSQLSKVRASRTSLRELPLQDGLMFAINNCHSPLKIVSSWKQAEKTDPRVKVFRYEDLTQGDNFEAFKQLFEHCGIPLADANLRDILKRYSFEALTKRAVGQADFSSHLRKGVAGDWANYFTKEVQEEFVRVLGDLPTTLGYPSTEEYLLDCQYRLIEQKMTTQQQDLNEIEGDFDSYAQAQRDVQQLKEQLNHAEAQAQQYQNHLQQSRAALQQTQTSLQQTKAALQQSQTQLANITAEANQLRQNNATLAASVDEAHQATNRVKENLNQFRQQHRELKQQHRELKQSLSAQKRIAGDRQAQIKAMESSKFWQLRSRWIRAKKRFGLAEPDE